ncbi:MAG: FtsH protease activity modulator HflK [Eubacteriales bacterium]
MSAGKIKGYFMGAIAVIVAIILISSVYRVDEGEQALVLTFGELTKTIDKAGLYWHMPIMQTVEKESTSKKYTFEYGYKTVSTATTSQGATYQDVASESIMLTSDLNIVSVQAIYQVVITDAEKFRYEVHEPFETLQYAFETIIRRNVQNITLDEAMVNKQAISEAVKIDFNKMLKSYNMGVTAEEVEIQNIVLPAAVDPAYQDVINAQNEKDRKTDEAEKYYYQVVPQSEAKAYKMIEDAEAYRAETIANAEGEVALFNAIYEKYLLNPEITRKSLYIETMERILQNVGDTYIIENSGDGTIKLLPIGGQ